MQYIGENKTDEDPFIATNGTVVSKIPFTLTFYNSCFRLPSLGLLLICGMVSVLTLRVILYVQLSFLLPRSNLAIRTLLLQLLFPMGLYTLESLNLSFLLMPNMRTYIVKGIFREIKVIENSFHGKYTLLAPRPICKY